MMKSASADDPAAANRIAITNWGAKRLLNVVISTVSLFLIFLCWRLRVGIAISLGIVLSQSFF
jgi:hypothetical protein